MSDTDSEDERSTGSLLTLNTDVFASDDSSDDSDEDVNEPLSLDSLLVSDSEDLTVADNVVCSKDYNNVKVSVVKDEIVKQKVDVIVNSTASSLDLNQGAASRALLAKAGQGVQQECKDKYPNGINEGDIAVTGSGNLRCKYLYNVCLKKWDGASTRKFLDQLVYKCLKKASGADLKSIAFPALGTGNLSYDKDQVARSMFKCVEKFQGRHPDTSVKDVKCVIFPADSSTLQAFVSRCQGQTVDTSDQCLCTVPVQNIKVNLVIGKLAEQQCDVIMTSCTRGLDMKRGRLSKSVLDAGGQSIQTECSTKYPTGIKHGEIAVLDPGNLPCKHLYCGAVPRHDKPPSDTKDTPVQLLTKLVTCCLQQATTDLMSSICFPTLGTGYLMFPPALAASTILKAISDFSVKNKTSSVKTVNIVIFAISDTIQKNKQPFEKECMKYKSSRPIPQRRRMVPTSGEIDCPSLGSVGGASACPGRNTPAFCMYKYGQTDIFPPSYWTVYTNNKTVKQWKVEHRGKPVYDLVDVDSATFKIVEKLVEDTWEPAKVGNGRDAEGLADITFTKLKVQKVQRVENLTLFESYSHKQQQLFHKAGEGQMFKKLSQLPNVRHGAPKTETNLDRTMTNHLYDEVNEVYLFHGTKPDKVDALLKQGMDTRLSQGQAVFGHGIYMAESSTKADQYADARKNRQKAGLRMFLVRSCLGRIKLMNDTKKFRRPPCLDETCNQDDCSHEERYDSIVSEGRFIFREFVVYETSQVYPEYVITYDRV